MIKIQCSKAQYKRLIKAGQSYFEDGKCFLGKTFLSCPYIDNKKADCSECIREHIKLEVK